MRRTKYEELIEPRLIEIELLSKAGTSINAIAKHLGVSRASLKRYREQHPDLDSILPNSKVYKKYMRINRGGRPKTPESIKMAFKSQTDDALKVLVSIMNDESQKASDRLKAAEAILDRGWGKPYQAIQLDEQQEKKVQVEFAPEMKEWLG